MRYEPHLPTDLQLSMEPLSEATHALLTTETCDPVLSVNDTGGSTDAVGLGVSGNPPVTNGDLAQTERALLDQGSEKVKTNFLELNDQQPPVNVPPSEIQPQITMTNLTGSVEDKVCDSYTVCTDIQFEITSNQN